MRFTFVHARWEDSANDSRVFQEAISDPKHRFPWPTPRSILISFLPNYCFYKMTILYTYVTLFWTMQNRITLLIQIHTG